MPTEEYPYSLQVYPGRRHLATSGLTIQTNTSESLQTIEYDAEAAQVKDHAALHRRMHRLRNPSSLEKDAGIFQMYQEMDWMAVESGRTTPRSKSDERLITTKAAIALQENVPKPSGRNSFKIVICQVIPILLVLGILWIPGILSWIEFPQSTILGVRFLFWSIWLTIAWGGFWLMIAVSYFTPSIFKSTLSVSSVHRWQHIHEVRAAHRYLCILIWVVVIWMSYQRLIVRNLQIKAPAEVAAPINMISRLLLGIIICAAFLTLEKFSIQRISEKFHERSYSQRIEDLQNFFQALCILYKHTVDVVVRSRARDSELRPDSIPHAGILKGRGHGCSLSEIAGSSVLQGDTEPFVRMALSTPGKSLSLGRRIFYSFSRSDTDYVMVEDIGTFFQTPEDAAIAFAFLDRDGNGDVSREELEAACLKFHQEQAAIADSMRDMDAALGQLNSIMVTLSCVACAVVLAVVMDAQIAPLMAGVCALVLGLSWLIGAGLHELMTSIIFVFAKHPFDVGDSVIIKNDNYTVKEIKLLSTVFLDTNSTLVQVSNHQLNNLFIHNSRRSSVMSETFTFDVHYSTTFQEVENIREKMLDFVKSENRDFQPVFDVTVKDFSGQSRMFLSADIKYKSNNVGLKVARRNKWLCALKGTLAELHINCPTAV